MNNISEADNGSNKQEFIHSNFGSLNSINPFFVSVITNADAHTGLIDTGADTSIIHEENVRPNIQRSDSINTIRSATGEALNIIGRIWNLEVKIGTEIFKLNLHIVRGSPKYMIIGYKDILKTSHLVFNLLNHGSFNSQKPPE